MPLPHAFANVTELDTPALDDNFNALGACSIIECTATGVNTVVLSPITNTPAVTAYTNNSPIFAFTAAASNTGATTVNVNGVGAFTVYKNNGFTAIGANDFVIGLIYYVAFNQTLNSGAGGFVLINPGATAATAGAVQGAFRNLVVTNTTTGAPNTQCAVTAGSISVSDGGANFTTLISVNVTVNSAASGAGGLDTGSLAATTWYAIYVIYNPSTTTTTALMSASFTSPTLPSGYTQFARVGAMITDGSKNFLRVLQKGRRAQYVVTSATNTAALPLIASGALGTGTGTSPTYASTSVAGFVPSTASAIKVTMMLQYNGNTSSGVILAPNTAYGGISGTNPPPIEVSSTVSGIFSDWMELESSSIALWSGGAGGAFFCSGWEDNL